MDKIKIDFTQYSLQELLDCKDNIDTQQYPDRAREVDLLIKDRSHQLNQNINQENPDQNNVDDFGFGSRFKQHRSSPFKGFLPNLGFGISQIVVGVIIWIAFGEFESEIPGTNEDTWMFVGFASVYGIVSGLYHLYKAFKEKEKFEKTQPSQKNKPTKTKKNYSDNNETVVRRN
jgi:hypothetical protein